jgi:hypothetical protein
LGDSEGACGDLPAGPLSMPRGSTRSEAFRYDGLTGTEA